MSLVDKLILEVQANTAKARAEIDKLGGALNKTDQAAGKTKSGLGGVIEKFTGAASAAAPYAAAIAAGGKIAFDAAEKFVNLAKDSLDLAAATGLSTEEASRWIAVGDDYRLTAGDMEGAVGKLSKALANTPQKFTDLGISTQDAEGKTRSANDIFIETLSALSNISNETDRAAAGNKIFGKSYATIAPLIGHTAEEYRDMLSAVSDGQVITDQEAAKAEKLRLAQDRLSDALGDLQLALGQAVTAAAPLINQIAWLIENLPKISGFNFFDNLLGDLSGGKASLAMGGLSLFATAVQDFIDNPLGKPMGELGKGFQESADAIDAASTSADTWISHLRDLTGATQETVTIQDGLAATAKAANKALEDQKKALEDAFKANKDYADNQQTLASASDDYLQFLTDLPDKLKTAQKESKKAGDFQRASNDLYREGVDKAKRWADAYVQAQRDAQGAAYDGKKAQSDYTSALLYTASITKGAAREAILGYIADVNRVPTDKRTEFKAVLDTYGAQAAKIYLDNLAAQRDAEIAPYVNKIKAGLVSVGLAALAAQRKAEINAHTNTTAAEIALAWLIRDRTTNVYARLIPQFAYGGQIPSGGMGLVAEAGFPEQVNGRTVSQPTIVRGPATVTSPLTSGRGGGGRTTIINNYPTGITPEAVARAQRRYLRRNGPDALTGF